MLEDKFINYISGFKSPFEEEELDQQDIEYDGYMQYQRDCIIKSIGTTESSVVFDSYFDEFIKACSEEQKKQFIKNCINKVVLIYRMSYLSSLLDEKEYSDDVLIDLIKFYGYKVWLKYYPKCISYINNNILNNESMLEVFLTSDYDNFITKLDCCKSCNELILNYYKYCSKQDGIKTLVRTLRDDIIGNFVIQYTLLNKK